jgi:hypothetical protein
MALAMAEEMGAEFHHLGSQKCNLENLEEVCRMCQYVPLTGGFHFVLIDEVDSASKAAQLALLSKLDSTDAPNDRRTQGNCVRLYLQFDGRIRAAIPKPLSAN